MPRTKNASAPGGGDDEDPRRPFWQVKGKTVYLEQQEGRKKRRTDREARAAAAAAAAAAQAALGDQPQIPSDQIAFRARRLTSRSRSSSHTSASTPPPTLPAPVTPIAPSTSTAIPTTSSAPASTASPAPAPASAPPVPPPCFRERDETEVRPLVLDPRLFDLQRATAARVRRFRYVPVESWLPAQRDPAASDLFSTRIQESFFRAQMSAQIALRVHRLLDLPAFLLAAGAESEAHLTYLPGLLTLLTISGRYVEEWVRVFYASVWIDPDHHWMRFRFEREDVTITASQIRQLFGFPESTTRLHSLCYGSSDPPRRPHGGVAPGTAHVAALFRPPFTDGSRRSPADFTIVAKYLYELIRRTLLPRMGYREATTHIQLWLLGALVSHSEFDVVDFLICEIEDTVLDGIRARRQLPYAHYLCHIFAQLIQPPRFQSTLEASRLVFGSYRPAPEIPVPASASVFDSQAEDAALRQFDTQGTAADDDDFGVPPPPPPPMPPRSHDHEAGSSRATPAPPLAMDPALATILANLAAEQARLSETMLSMFQSMQDRQDALQQQLLQDRAENRAFMALMLQHSGISAPPVQSAPPPPLHAPVVPSILSGPPVGTSSLRPVTLAFTSPVLSSVCPQPPVPPASAVTTTAVAVSVTASVPVAPAARPQSESVPAPASTADPGSETDSDPPSAFALLPRPRPDAPPPPPPASDV
jgi:hypothetical protein